MRFQINPLMFPRFLCFEIVCKKLVMLRKPYCFPKEFSTSDICWVKFCLSFAQNCSFTLMNSCMQRILVQQLHMEPAGCFIGMFANVKLPFPFCHRSPSVVIEHEKAENRRQPSFTGPDGNPPPNAKKSGRRAQTPEPATELGC